MIFVAEKVEPMDPDFGRSIAVGYGFGAISADEYDQLENDVEKIEQMDPDFGRGYGVGVGFGTISAEEYNQMIAELG